MRATQNIPEEFIYFIWQHRLFNHGDLLLTSGERIEIIQPGFRNDDSGPDFSDARIRIDGTLWAGNIEIHSKASDWYLHLHHLNPSFQTIILHVVYTNDQPVIDKNGQLIPCLELNGRIQSKYWRQYQALQLSPDSKIACATHLPIKDKLIERQWMDSALQQRLHRKSREISAVAQQLKNDWEEVFYQLLLRSLGQKVNADAMQSLAVHTPLSLIRKIQNKPEQIEALLFGQAGFLNRELKSLYYSNLVAHYQRQRTKHSLNGLEFSRWKFMRMRPPSFPSIRIAQAAGFLAMHPRLLDTITRKLPIKELRKLFVIEMNPFWENHFRFGKESIESKKSIGKGTVDRIIINCIVPFLYCYGIETAKPELIEYAIELLEKLPAEKNKITKQWLSEGVTATCAADSQALLEQYSQFCLSKKCLSCTYGKQLLLT